MRREDAIKPYAGRKPNETRGTSWHGHRKVFATSLTEKENAGPFLREMPLFSGGWRESRIFDCYLTEDRSGRPYERTRGTPRKSAPSSPGKASWPRQLLSSIVVKYSG